MSEDDPYTYPGSAVLRNKLGLVDAARLDRIERLLVTQRATEGIPTGRFDLDHLRAIHRYLFQDVYDWAGGNPHRGNREGRSPVPIPSVYRDWDAGHPPPPRAGHVPVSLKPAGFRGGGGADRRDVNYVHPFREGNGRTQLLYLEQLAGQAGHPIDLARLNPQRWIEASRASHDGDYGPMSAAITQTLTGHSLRP